MWLINSSIGRKVIMSVTGIALILFMTFHCCMNLVALFSGSAYNMICELLGANWYAVVATVGLGALAVCHIVYASSLQHRTVVHVATTVMQSQKSLQRWSGQARTCSYWVSSSCLVSLFTCSTSGIT